MENAPLYLTLQDCHAFEAKIEAKRTLFMKKHSETTESCPGFRIT